jgi:hypothetical protein
MTGVIGMAAVIMSGVVAIGIGDKNPSGPRGSDLAGLFIEHMRCAADHESASVSCARHTP